MAVLYISEFQRISNHNTYGPQIVPLPPVASQAVPFGSTSAALSPGTNIVRVVADAACTIALGTSSTVTPLTSDLRLQPGVPEYFAVPHTIATAITPLSYYIGATVGS